MKSAVLLRVIAVVIAICTLVAGAEAATIFTGPPLVFSKQRDNDENQPAFQDRITPKVWLTRGARRGLYNIRQESGFTRATSPADTEWAFGTTANLPNLKFTPWNQWHGQCPPCAVGKDAVLHLISEDIYIDIRILSWPSGSGNVTYQRSTVPASRPLLGPAAVEYFHREFNHYFTTAYVDEATLLDALSMPGTWIRTGQTYTVSPAPAAGLVPVCRFFSASFAPKSSHFHTLDPAECAQVKANSAWQYEGDAFFARPADSGGGCPAATTPLHRLYNNGLSGAPNHRYTTCASIRDGMVGKGWVSEGVAMCVEGGSGNCALDRSAAFAPDAPSGITATPGNANITVSFTPPADGGSPITRYTASCGSIGASKTATNTRSPVTVRGLPNTIRQSCTVFATNEVGDGPPSVTVQATPTAITNTTFNPLWVPPLLSSTTLTGTRRYELTLATSSKQFLPGAVTATYSYNNNGFWGPTLLLNQGDTVQLQVRNTLDEDTTTHWHGLLLSGRADGGPHNLIPAGTTWLTEPFIVRNNAATYWYHPHRHETTQKQLTRGAGGFIIIRDPEEAALALPRNYGIDDIPLALTSRRFAAIDGVPNQLQYVATAYGDHMFTNGTMNAQITLPQQVVRLRILNGEIEREYNLGFNNGRTFHVIGNDGGLLSAPVPVTHLVIAPGERYEILVNLRNDPVGTALDVESHAGPDSDLNAGFAGFEDESGGEFGSLLNYRSFRILRINVGGATFSPITAIPAELAANTGLAALDPANATQNRILSITGGPPDGPFLFDEMPFDMERIDHEVALGTTETWTVRAGALSSHSFHIHGVQFRIVARNGSATEVKPWEAGWKDTFYIPIAEQVTFAVRFGETADAIHPFMYHCHMINHEDEGLMGQFTVR